MIIIKKILIFLCFFLAFNTLEVDSNSDKIVYYDQNDKYNKKVYTLYFDNINSLELNKIIKDYNLEVFSYIVDNKKYYVKNIEELDNKYLSDKTINEKVYYIENGYYITSIKVLCSVEDIINIKNKTHIY